MKESPRYLCRGNNRNTVIVFFIFLGIAVLAFVAMQLELSTPVTCQAILFLSLIIAAYVYIRYLATAYLYKIVEEEGEHFLLAIRCQGKRQFTRCKLSLSALCGILTVNTRASQKPTLPRVPVSNFSSLLLAEEYTLLYFDDGKEQLLLRINADEAFLSVLSSLAPNLDPAFAQTVDASAPSQSAEEKEEADSATERPFASPYDVSDLLTPDSASSPSEDKERE